MKDINVGKRRERGLPGRALPRAEGAAVARGAGALDAGRRAGGRHAGRAGAAPRRSRRQLLHAHYVDHRRMHCTPSDHVIIFYYSFNLQIVLIVVVLNIVFEEFNQTGELLDIK